MIPPQAAQQDDPFTRYLLNFAIIPPRPILNRAVISIPFHSEQERFMANPDSTGRAASPIGPARALVSVIPSDAADLPNGVTRSLFVGEAGLVAVIDADGNTAVLSSAAHQYHPIQVRRVLAAGTTAAGIVAPY